MKLRHIIIIGSLLLILGLIYYPILNAEPEEKKDKPIAAARYLPVMEVLNKVRSNSAIAYGQVMPNNQIDVTLEVQGVIDRDNRSLKVGTAFQKNELLVKIDRTEALYNLLARRSSFANLILTMLPDLSIDLPEEKAKWEQYLNKLTPTEPLPALPDFSSKKEQYMVNARNIPSEFYNIKSQERLLEKYYYLAPFNGTIIASMVEPGSNVTPGMRILTISKTSDYEVKAPVSLKNLSLFQQANQVDFLLPSGEKIGTGKYVRKAQIINAQTQSIDLFFSIQPDTGKELIQGMFLNLRVEGALADASVSVPDNAVVENRVQLLNDSIIQWLAVAVLSSKPDSLFVKGIPDKSKLILEPVTNPNDTTKFIGILK